MWLYCSHIPTCKCCHLFNITFLLKWKCNFASMVKLFWAQQLLCSIYIFQFIFLSVFKLKIRKMEIFWNWAGTRVWCDNSLSLRIGLERNWNHTSLIAFEEAALSILLYYHTRIPDTSQDLKEKGVNQQRNQLLPHTSCLKDTKVLCNLLLLSLAIYLPQNNFPVG